jgi:5-methylthioadenosine/S-adenosylhomocysteine deaminase
MRTLIHNGTVVLLNDAREIYQPGYVLIDADRIWRVESGNPPQELLSQVDEVIDARQMLVMPGLVNAHTHLFQTFIRGLGDGKPLQGWLQAYIWPVGSRMGTAEARLSALLGMVENIHSGVTAVIDNQYIHNTPDTDDAYCQAAVDTGIRYLLARGWADRNYHPAFLESCEEIIERVGGLVERWNTHGSGRIRVEFGPLSKQRCSNDTMLRTREAGKAWGIGLHMHTSETEFQTNFCIEEEKVRTVEWLDGLGCLGPDTQIVHAVWLSDHEIDLIAERGAKVVHCPVSNMYLASGIARIPEMVRKGICVALATDGPGSNNNQDMIETLKTTSLLAKISTMDADVFNAGDLLWMACGGGAQAFGQPDQIGSLEVGKKADIILVDLGSPFAAPVHDPVSALVYCLHGSDVDTVLIDGKTVMRNKKITLLDEDALLAECREAATALVSQIPTHMG